MAFLVFFDEGTLVALGHFTWAVGFEDEGDMTEEGGGDTEGLKELHVFAGVGKVVFAANDVGNFHGDIVDNVDEVEDGEAVGPEDDKVFIFASADFTADDIVDDLFLA